MVRDSSWIWWKFVARIFAASWLVLIPSGCEPIATPVSPKDALRAPSTRSAIGDLPTIPAALRPWPRTVRVQGDLIGDERVVVGAKVAGRIQSLGRTAGGIPIDLGTSVQAGDVLASLEAEEFDLRVQQAAAQMEQVRATLGLLPDDDESKLDVTRASSVLQAKFIWDEAQANWRRAEALNRETAISAEELQQRKTLVDVDAARYESAQHSVRESLALLGVRRAELALARQARIDTDIRAPFGGIVEQRHVAPGAYVQVGQPVVALVKTDPLRFRAGVPEREATRIRLGQTVLVQLEGEEQPRSAKITRISPSLDVSSRSLTIEADLPNPELGLRTGLFAEAEIVVDPDARALAVPARAVREFAGVEKVQAVRNGEVVEQPIQVGRRDSAWVEIVGGLAAGDRVVVDKADAGL